MHRSDAPASFVDLAAAQIRLRPAEAAAIVRELALQVARGELPGVPSAHVIRLSPTGAISVEGPIGAFGQAVGRAAQLLEMLLPPTGAPAEFRAPGALRLIVARAQGALDLPPYPSLEAFCEALARFAAPDVQAVVRGIAANWAAAAPAQPTEPEETPPAEAPRTAVLETFGSSPLSLLDGDHATVELPVSPSHEFPSHELTISDIRRARRATGLTLTQVGERSRIPAELLRELEWGYLTNWPAGHYGRTQLVRYARAAGLDDELVVQTVWPLLETAALARGSVMPQAPVPAVEPLETLALTRQAAEYVDVLDGDVLPAYVANTTTRRRRGRVLAALAIPALLVIAVLPVAWQRGWLTTPSALLALPTESTPAVPRAPVAAERTPVASTSVVPSRSEGVAGSSGTVAPAPAAGDATPASASGAPTARRADGLTPDGVAYSPAFASVGSAMFYHSNVDGPSALLRADTSSSGAILRITRIVDDSSRNYHARPSPDGTRIAFDSDRDGERGVYVADADGRNVRRVTGEGFAAIPSWSPDGGTLAFVRAEPERPRVWNLWTVELASGETRRLTNHAYGQPWGGSWFPDGRRLAYSHEDRLIVLDVERGRQRVYPSPRKGHLVRTPAVSPDGTRVIFQVFRDGAWLLDLADGSMRKVLADPTAEEYTWSPDGQRVAYHSRRSDSWGVWVMAPR